MDRRPDDMWINETLVHRIGERIPEFYNYLLEEGIDQPDHENQFVFDEENFRGITGFKNRATRGQEVFGRWMPALAEKLGVEVRTHARVTGLKVDGSAVTGVTAAPSARMLFITLPAPPSAYFSSTMGRLWCGVSRESCERRMSAIQ